MKFQAYTFLYCGSAKTHCKCLLSIKRPGKVYSAWNSIKHRACEQSTTVPYIITSACLSWKVGWRCAHAKGFHKTRSTHTQTQCACDAAAAARPKLFTRCRKVSSRSEGFLAHRANYILYIYTHHAAAANKGRRNFYLAFEFLRVEARAAREAITVCQAWRAYIQNASEWIKEN